MNILLLAGEGVDGGMGMMGMMIYLVVIFGFLYFFMMRPQKKERKRHAEMIAQVEIGDSVLTNSGFYGTIIDVSEDTVIVEFGNNKNCRIPMQRKCIAQIEKPDAE